MTQNLQKFLSIYECKREIIIIVENLSRLKDLHEKLKNSIDQITDDEWRNCIQEINEIKLKIKKLLQKYCNFDNNGQLIESINLKILKQKLLKRVKKRSKLKNKYEKLKILKSLQLKNREKLNKQINEWLQSEKDKNIKLLKQNDDEKQTELILSGVTKKCYEAQRYIQLLMSLKELRKIRKVATETYKNQLDLNEKNFENQTNQLISVWEDALNEYECEEKTLRKLLNNNKTNKSINEQWNECLFGNYSKNEILEPKSETNIDDFLEIRNSWDSYIVPENSSHSSSIPIGWVLPNENPSSEWVLYKSCSQNEN